MGTSHPRGDRCPWGDCDSILVWDAETRKWVCPNGFYTQEPTPAELAYIDGLTLERS